MLDTFVSITANWTEFGTLKIRNCIKRKEPIALFFSNLKFVTLEASELVNLS
jgi:hypothetical protein